MDDFADLDAKLEQERARLIVLLHSLADQLARRAHTLTQLLSTK